MCEIYYTRFEALVECDFILEILWSKSLLASNPKRLKRLSFSPEGLTKSEIRMFDYRKSKYMEIPCLAALNIK